MKGRLVISGLSKITSKKLEVYAYNFYPRERPVVTDYSVVDDNIIILLEVSYNKAMNEFDSRVLKDGE